MIQTIHPFPARMAPELALETLKALPPQSVVLDPMSGSGTVIRQAAEMGHHSLGFDMDPLAVLMSRVWTTFVEDELIGQVSESLLNEAKALKLDEVVLPWIDEDLETQNFINYWFGKKQQDDLRRISYVLYEFSKRRFSKKKHAAADVVRIALSRIIITKEQGASLARDTSHSRPHKVTDYSDYDVFAGLSRSLKQVRSRLKDQPALGETNIRLGDARALRSLHKSSVDAVITSPPYLNAIDYLRGHRMSLVWLGYSFGNLRLIRSNSIGAERAPDKPFASNTLELIKNSMCDASMLSKRYISIIDRYSEDIYRMVSEIARVTRTGGSATFVVGNSCLQGLFIKNSAGVAMAATTLGFRELKISERALPERNRYLPITANGALGKRMRTETILAFERV